MKQYPLEMGRKNAQGSSTGVKGGGTVALQVDAEGKVRYDVILRQGMRKEQYMASSYRDLVEKNLEDHEMAKPSSKKAKETAEKTRKALEKMLNASIASTQPRALAHERKKVNEPVYIKYTPHQKGSTYNSGSSTRIIKLHDLPKDPLEPPRYRARKLPARPPSPPVPIMHSPQRKVTVKDQQNWKIPPCVSNYKNNRGYMLPLEARMASDGRGLQEKTINDKFAKLAESLYIAEREARKQVEDRAKIRMALDKRKKERREVDLRAQAQKVLSGAVDRDLVGETPMVGGDTPGIGGTTPGRTQEEIDALEERNQLRKDRARERKRNFRMEQRKVENRVKRAKVGAGGVEQAKNSMAARNKDRDVTEKIALGQHTGKRAGGSHDTRLYNQDSGLSSGFGADDDYNTFDKPLFNSAAKSIYRPTADPDSHDKQTDLYKMMEKSSKKFTADRGFEGSTDGNRSRAQPVEFEKEKIEKAANEFGFEQYVTEERNKKLDMIGKKGRGVMSAGGGSARSKDEFVGSGRARVEYVEEVKEQQIDDDAATPPAPEPKKKSSRDRDRRDSRKEERRDRSIDGDVKDEKRSRKERRSRDDEERSDRKKKKKKRRRSRSRSRERRKRSRSRSRGRDKKKRKRSRSR